MPCKANTKLNFLTRLYCLSFFVFNYVDQYIDIFNIIRIKTVTSAREA